LIIQIICNFDDYGFLVCIETKCMSKAPSAKIENCVSILVSSSSLTCLLNFQDFTIKNVIRFGLYYKNVPITLSKVVNLLNNQISFSMNFTKIMYWMHWICVKIIIYKIWSLHIISMNFIKKIHWNSFQYIENSKNLHNNRIYSNDDH